MVGMETSRRGGGRGIGKRKTDNRFSGRSSKKHQKSDGRGTQSRRTVEKPPSNSSNIELSGSEEENEVVLDHDVTAYSTLLQSLQSKGGSFAEMYAQRQREEQGASSSDEEDEPEEGDVADGISPHENVGDAAEVGSQSVEIRNSADEEIEEEIESGKESGGESDKLEEGKEEIESGKDGDDESDEVKDDQLGDDSEEDGIEADAANGGQESSSPDPFKNHVGHQLGQNEVAKLLEGKEKFTLITAAAGVQGGTWVFNTSSLVKDEKHLQAYAVKKRLQDSWRGSCKKASWGDFESEQQCQFFSLCSSYQDILHTKKLSTKDDGQEDLSYMDAYVFHILGHVLKTRDLITKNNEKLQRDPAESPRDQGFTRPKILVLLPFRSSALKFVDRLLKLAPPLQRANVEHKARFFDDFGVEDEDPEEEKSGQKPADFRALFSGNNDDHFRIGIKFTRKSIKLYSEFYTSDIIVASPVGLMTRIGEAEIQKNKGVDFLSSIEITVVDFADVILMQNWAHVVAIFGHLNRIPSEQHGTDFMRIREWCLNGQARHFRQSIILCSFSDASVNALFRRACVNHEGKVKLRCEYEGVLSRIVLQVRQVYEKIDCSLITDVDDSRFEFFAKQVFPRLKNSLETGTMIYTRSYFDFVRLRNFLKAQSASFCLLGEYSKQSDVSRARSWFYHGKRRIMVYTERAHFFHRYKIRGIKDIIFYSIPDHAQFYVELLNLLEGKDNPSCTVLFSRFDNLQLERIAGSARSKKMISSPNKLFMFC